jgi:hypothetical protein
VLPSPHRQGRQLALAEAFVVPKQGATLAFAAPAQAVVLVAPAGKPVHGQWQRWANEAKVPTVRRLVLDVSAVDAQNYCGGADACSMGWEGGQARETIVAPDAGRRDFYYELGHQFDWQILNDGDRSYLAREWGDPHSRWLDSTASVNAGAEDGLEAVFPQIYADCAFGISDKGNDMAIGFVGKNYSPPGVTPKINTCQFLTTIALHRHDAAVSGSRRWSWIPASQVAPPTTVTTS